MFYINAPSGRVFSGSLEKLRRVDKISAADSKQILLNAGDEDDSLYSVAVDQNAVSKKQISQYGELLKENGQREPVQHAYQIMSSSVQVLMADWSLTKAVEQFKKLPYQVFPIINRRRELIGLLSRQKLYEHLLTLNKEDSAWNNSIEKTFLTADSKMYSADPVTDIRRIATLLVEDKLNALPIVEESGRLVGIVSRTDILRSAISDPPLSLWC